MIIKEQTLNYTPAGSNVGPEQNRKRDCELRTLSPSQLCAPTGGGGRRGPRMTLLSHSILILLCL